MHFGRTRSSMHAQIDTLASQTPDNILCPNFAKQASSWTHGPHDPILADGHVRV